MVTNGGYSGVQHALAYGVPLIVAGDTADKAEVAARVAYNRCGIDLHTARPMRGGRGSGTQRAGRRRISPAGRSPVPGHCSDELAGRHSRPGDCHRRPVSSSTPAITSFPQLLQANILSWLAARASQGCQARAGRAARRGSQGSAPRRLPARRRSAELEPGSSLSRAAEPLGYLGQGHAGHPGADPGRAADHLRVNGPQHLENAVLVTAPVLAGPLPWPSRTPG